MKSVFIALGLTDARSLRDLAVAAIQVHGKYSVPSSDLSPTPQLASFWLSIAF